MFHFSVTVFWDFAVEVSPVGAESFEEGFAGVVTDSSGDSTITFPERSSADT